MNDDAHPAGGALALELRDIDKRFGVTVALEGASLRVATGSVHALLGENGAGKTSLMRIAYGMLRADRGALRLFGRDRPLGSHTVREAMRAGIGMVHQHLSLVPTLTAVENVALGNVGERFDIGATARRLDAAAREAGLDVPGSALVRDLSIVEQQRLEILKALSLGAKLLILDEPTAVLAPAEIDELLAWLRAFARAGGSVILVTHKLREALAVADAVTVLRRGRIAHTGAVGGMSEADLARTMFPEHLARTAPPVPSHAAEAIVSAAGASIADRRGVLRIVDATFELRRHEIVGVAAVEGSGHRELLLALAGHRAVRSGSLRTPASRGWIPADRMGEGLVAEMSLTENVALRNLGARRGLMPWNELARETDAVIARYRVVATGTGARAGTLSGGNQQRLVVGRELSADAELIVADNPTRGLDLRSTEFVHEQLRAAAQRGAVVVVHSNDLDELIGLATRVLVVHHGQVREVPVDAALVGRAMLGAA